ncbi:MAG: 16S rRNA (cytidine(1402)-2'-O)-methyltransferase [Anaerolineae bacterium]|nr:16S rRNA (cytidine(1402)-2'-O)-methyltransferase [Anaerolineae bacterium]
MGTLYLVGTPIGNLEDITLRALRILREVALIAAEDTRHTRTLLARYDIRTPTTSYFEHNKLAKLDAILAALETGDVALVSDAGMPGISDPGYELVRAALARGFPVVPVPGPSAIVAALAASGLPTDAFVYVGFLPRKAGERRRALESLRDERRTLVLYEAPHRLLDTLADILTTLGDRPVAIARELTKVHEEIWRGTVSEARAHFAEHAPRGEFTLVIGGAAEPQAWTEEQVREALARRLAEGWSARDAATDVAARSGWPKRDVYRIAAAHTAETRRAQR